LTGGLGAILGSERLAVESTLAKFSGVVNDADQPVVFQPRWADDADPADGSPAARETTRGYDRATSHIVNSVLTSYQDRYVLQAGSFYAFIQYLDNPALLLEHLK